MTSRFIKPRSGRNPSIRQRMDYKMKHAKFLEEAGEAGFTGEMADFLWETFSLKPHTHTADQISDFDEAVTAVVESEIEEDEDDEKDD